MNHLVPRTRITEPEGVLEPGDEFMGTFLGFPVFLRRSMRRDRVELHGKRQGVILDLQSGEVTVMER